MADNTRVWNEWKAMVQEGPGWDFIKRYNDPKDGRRAVRMLISQNESTNGLTARKNKAYEALSSLMYSGPSRNWTFEQYVNGHLHAHNKLEYCGEPVHPAKKVQDFLDGITDSRLENARGIILGDPDKMEDFDAAQKYMTLVNSNKSTSVKRKGQQISSTASEKSRKIKKG